MGPIPRYNRHLTWVIRAKWRGEGNVLRRNRQGQIRYSGQQVLFPALCLCQVGAGTLHMGVDDPIVAFVYQQGDTKQCSL